MFVDISKLFASLTRLLKLSPQFGCKSHVVIWAPDFFKLSFWTGDNSLKVLAAASSLQRSGHKYSIHTSIRLDKIACSYLVTFPSRSINPLGLPDHASFYRYAIKHLELSAIKCIPSYHEISFWENKLYMHDQFDKLAIRTPTTISFANPVHLPDIIAAHAEKLRFPCLLKQPYSCSSKGLYKVESADRLAYLVDYISTKSSSQSFFLQELLDIRKDLRVVVLNGSVSSFYWRINKSSAWMPTSTSLGSQVLFSDFPQTWKSLILEYAKLLNLRFCAFDIAWNHDDLTSAPYVLEVSPLFQPNPIPVKSKNLVSYGKWKKSFSMGDNYQARMASLVDDIVAEILSICIS
jgi:hypothetical protein